MQKQTTNRLSKILASAGVASRRACETLIFDGRVQVNGETTLLPQTMVDPSKDKITVDGKPIGAQEEKVYYMLNKPAGYICSNKRLENTKLVIDLFPGTEYRLFTVGRLDKDTEGLILVTNDGHFANDIIHPSKEISKEYLAKTDQDISHEHLTAIASGTLVEGTYIKPLKVEKVRRGTVKVTVAEGKKHEVRYLLEAAGLQIFSLTRIRIGSLVLGTLPLGSWRELTEKEKQSVLK
jgi:23S rRNA pseudouridine2605 synthase